MNARFFVPLAGAVLFTLTNVAHAHGGIYRGPGDTTPPSPGGSGPRGTGPATGQPGHPTSPGVPNPMPTGGPSTGPAQPTATPPGGNPPGRTTGIPIDLGPDL
jgi:hypothetical protein